MKHKGTLELCLAADRGFGFKTEKLDQNNRFGYWAFAEASGVIFLKLHSRDVLGRLSPNPRQRLAEHNSYANQAKIKINNYL
jgi:hypothetical protein